MRDLYITLRITQIIRETPDTYTYRFESADGKSVPYRAGQFLTFLIDLHGTEYRRSYSLSTTPGIDEYLAITVKRVTNGAISRHIIRHWQVGDTVTSLLPSGRFVLDSEPDAARDIIMLGAGSGITPLFSLLQQALHEEKASHVTLIYSNRNEENTIFRSRIQALEALFHDRLTVVWIFSDPVDAAPASGG